MGLFSDSWSDLNSWLDGRRKEGDLREYIYTPADWRREKSVVLKADTGLELGNPFQASLSLMIWNEKAGAPSPNRVMLIGPDLGEFRGGAMPLARLVLVEGDFLDEYDTYRDLISAIHGVSLAGVTSRSLPSRHEIWLRISRGAIEEGLTLGTMGNAVIDELRELAAVESVCVVYVTQEQAISSLRPIAERAHTIIDALVKMYDEMNFDCETCEYVEVCDEVLELKNIRDRLRGSN